MQTIKNKFPLFLFLVFLMLGVFYIGTNWVKAVGDAYFPQDTTIVLDVGNFRIVGGSDADTVTASNTQVTVTISTGQSLTIESDDRKLLNNDLGYTYSCFSNKSSIIIDTTTTTKTVVITPSSSNCGSTGGGGGSVTVSPTLTPTPTVSSTPTSLSTPTSTVTSTPASTYATPAPTLLLGASLAKLYRKSGDPKIYVLQSNGLLKWVKSLDDFNTTGYLWKNVKVISKNKFSKLKIDVSPNAPVLTTPLPVSVLSHLRIKSGFKFLNIRSTGSLKGKIVGRVLSGQEFEFTSSQNGWYRIKKDGKDLGWISGDYILKF